VSSWAEAIKIYKNAVLQSRFGIDHLGFPAGKLIQWNEDFGSMQPFVGTGVIAATPLPYSRWGVVNFTTGNINSISAIGAYAIDPVLPSAMVQLVSAAIVGSNHLYAVNPAVVHIPGMAISYQWDAYIQGTDAASAEIFGGLISAPLTGVGGAISTIAPTGVGFIKRTGDANWFTYNNGTYVTTGIAAASATRFRFRLELLSAAAADAGTAQVIFYVNGTRITAAQSATAPLLGLGCYPVFRNARTAIGTTGYSLLIGANDFRANLWPGDVFL
jgi:hypothetical protein